MKVSFVDTGASYLFFSKIKNLPLQNENADDNEIWQNITSFNKPLFTDNHFSSSLQLQLNILNSLNYVAQNGGFPSDLPEQLNIKFINHSKSDYFKSLFKKNPIAQFEIPNTIHISTDLLPENQENSPPGIVRTIKDTFYNPQQVLDLIVFHELGHLIFFNKFKECITLNETLLHNLKLKDKIIHKFGGENYTDIPLYQIHRTFEEHFSDLFSAMLLNVRYSTEPDVFFKIRNYNEFNSIGFNVNINKLDKSFANIKEINSQKKGIEESIHKIANIALSGAINVFKNEITLQNNDNFLSKIEIALRNNLKLCNIYSSSQNNLCSLLNEIENIIKEKILPNNTNLKSKLNAKKPKHHQDANFNSRTLKK